MNLFSKYKQEVKEYFKIKAGNYDLVDSQIYWKLSDHLLFYILKEKILKNLVSTGEPIKFLDAGGGTGRWSLKILNNYPGSYGKIIDFSTDMLSEASKKIKDFGLQDRLEVENADLDKISLSSNNNYIEQYNLVFSFHNVIGFVKSPLNLIKFMYNSLRKGGYIILLSPNLFHNIFFNIDAERIDSAIEALNFSKGTFTKDMPALNLFTPVDIENLFKQAKLKDYNVTGFPSAIYPKTQETQIQGSTENLSNLLKKNNLFFKIFEIEKKLLEYPDIASRGNQLLAIGKK